MAYKSKIIYKDLNPTWDESFTLGIEDPFEPIVMKVRCTRLRLENKEEVLDELYVKWNIRGKKQSINV